MLSRALEGYFYAVGFCNKRVVRGNGSKEVKSDQAGAAVVSTPNVRLELHALARAQGNFLGVLATPKAMQH